MKWTVRLLFFLMIQLTLLSTGVSQDLTQMDRSIAPISPTAYELGKYGYLPVGMYTGTASYSIPLYELKGKNLSLPISLNYYSNVIKADLA